MTDCAFVCITLYVTQAFICYIKRKRSTIFKDMLGNAYAIFQFRHKHAETCALKIVVHFLHHLSLLLVLRSCIKSFLPSP